MVRRKVLEWSKYHWGEDSPPLLWMCYTGTSVCRSRHKNKTKKHLEKGSLEIHKSKQSITVAIIVFKV